MPFNEGYELVRKAYTKQDKEKWYQLWLVRQPNDGKHITSFEKWYKELQEQTEQSKYMSDKSKDEIMAEVEAIRKKAAKSANI